MKPRPYTFPSANMLISDNSRNEAAEDSAARATAGKLQSVIDSFSVNARVAQFKVEAQRTIFLVDLGAGVKVNKVTGLCDNFSLATGQPCTVGMKNGQISIEVPNAQRRMLRIGDFKGKWDGCANISFALGDGLVCDLAKMPHLLIAGTTGSGKSVCMNSIIMSFLYRCHPDQVKLLLIDPHKVDFAPYNGLPHLLRPVITEVKDAEDYLRGVCKMMDDRYAAFEKVGARTFDEYAAITGTWFTRVVVIIDELADLMLTRKKAVEPLIVRLAQRARATGIHLVIATQHPTRDIITGLIKANMPCRIAFKTVSGIDSRVILDQTGAEKLLGMGDLLYKSGDSTDIIRAQGVYVSNEEVNRVCDFIRSQGLVPSYQKKQGFFSKLFGVE